MNFKWLILKVLLAWPLFSKKLVAQDNHYPQPSSQEVLDKRIHLNSNLTKPDFQGNVVLRGSCIFAMFLLSIRPKGQLISKGLFGILNSPKKKERKNSTSLLWYLKSNCFHSFFGRIEDTKKKVFELRKTESPWLLFITTL